MNFPRSTTILITCITLTIGAPRQTEACGPAVHIREASRLMELLVEVEPQWAEVIEQPLAMSYLWLGSIAPDFQWMADELHFGHGTDLGYHLLDRAAELGPHYTLFAMLQLADEFFGSMSREQARSYIAIMMDAQPATLLDLLTEGLLSFLGIGGERSPHFDDERQRVRSSPLVDREFWTLYDDLADLGPRFALDRYFTRQLGWPGWDGDAIVCGNIQSLLRYLPEGDDGLPGLIVDDLVFLDGTGEPIRAVDLARENSALTARVRFYSSLPFDGVIKGVVRKDRPGFDTAADEILGEARVEVSVDPLDYVNSPRTVLEIPFVADPADALGYYVELYADDAEHPWLTTSWDRIWTIDEVNFDWPVYRDNFGTYGHWPPSLPLSSPRETPTALFVKTHVAPAGRGIAGAVVVLDETGASITTGPNGIAIFEPLADGTYTLSSEAAGYHPSDPVVVAPLDLHWVFIPLHVIPIVAADEYHGDRECVAFIWDLDPFSGQAQHFWAQPYDLDGEMVLVEESEA